MKKLITISILVIIAIILLYLYYGEHGLFGGLLGVGMLGGNEVMRKLKKQGEVLDKEAEAKTEELRKLEEEKKNLKVEDLTPEEEKEYWKDV